MRESVIARDTDLDRAPSICITIRASTEQSHEYGVGRIRVESMPTGVIAPTTRHRPEPVSPRDRRGGIRCYSVSRQDHRGLTSGACYSNS